MTLTENKFLRYPIRTVYSKYGKHYLFPGLILLRVSLLCNSSFHYYCIQEIFWIFSVNKQDVQTRWSSLVSAGPKEPFVQYHISWVDLEADEVHRTSIRLKARE